MLGHRIALRTIWWRRCGRFVAPFGLLRIFTGRTTNLGDDLHSCPPPHTVLYGRSCCRRRSQLGRSGRNAGASVGRLVRGRPNSAGSPRPFRELCLSSVRTTHYLTPRPEADGVPARAFLCAWPTPRAAPGHPWGDASGYSRLTDQHRRVGQDPADLPRNSVDSRQQRGTLMVVVRSGLTHQGGASCGGKSCH